MRVALSMIYRKSSFLKIPLRWLPIRRFLLCFRQRWKACHSRLWKEEIHTVHLCLAKHNRLLVRSRARVGDPRFERSVPRHRLGCDGGRRSCDRGNHGGARLFGDAIELALWRCVNRATRRSSIPSLHQDLMQGRSRMDDGCTVDAFPYSCAHLEASKLTRPV